MPIFMNPLAALFSAPVMLAGVMTQIALCNVGSMIESAPAPKASTSEAKNG